jgi:hypothetical protein
MRPATLPLDRLIRDATVIAVSRVEKIEAREGIRVAIVVVTQALKGCRIGQRLTYLASKTWTCDISDAKPNEAALLLLCPARGNPFSEMYPKERRQFDQARRKSLRNIPLLTLVHSGNGRMPVVKLRTGEYIKQPLYVSYPDDLPTLPDPAPTYRAFRHVTITDMTAYIQRQLAVRPGDSSRSGE